MSIHEQSEKLVQIHQARDEWEGNVVVGYLRENGVEAMLQSPPAVPPLDAIENLSGSTKVNGVFVLEHEAERAQALLMAFQSSVADEDLLEEEAAHALKLDKETIAQLRGALKEEKKTFEFLGWVGVAFFSAAALLWAIWPPWLKLAPPPPEVRWTVLILLMLVAVFAGSWASRRLK
jgi:hypothetical protein